MPPLEGLQPLVGVLAASAESLQSACKGKLMHKELTRPTPECSRAMWSPQGCPASGFGWLLVWGHMFRGFSTWGFQEHVSVYFVWWCSKHDAVIRSSCYRATQPSYKTQLRISALFPVTKCTFTLCALAHVEVRGQQAFHCVGSWGLNSGLIDIIRALSCLDSQTLKKKVCVYLCTHAHVVCACGHMLILCPRYLWVLSLGILFTFSETVSLLARAQQLDYTAGREPLGAITSLPSQSQVHTTRVPELELGER